MAESSLPVDPVESDRPSDPAPIVAGPQAEPAVVPREPPAGAPPVLDDDQRTLLAAILDRIVPANGPLPGAGELGVGATIERTLAVSPSLRRLFFEGFVEVRLASSRRADRDFRALDPDAQDALLGAVEIDYPAFFVALVEHTYRGYYTDPRVHAAIGWESRPPQPLGHHLPAFDPSLLDAQRGREPFWRRTS